MQKLNHPNVLAHIRTAVLRNRIVAVTEYCEAGDLGSLLHASRAPFSEGFVRHAVLEIASGLAHMHAHLVAHRDVKPENVLMTSDGHFKVRARVAPHETRVACHNTVLSHRT